MSEKIDREFHRLIQVVLSRYELEMLFISMNKRGKDVEKCFAVTVSKVGKDAEYSRDKEQFKYFVDDETNEIKKQIFSEKEITKFKDKKDFTADPLVARKKTLSEQTLANQYYKEGYSKPEPKGGHSLAFDYDDIKNLFDDMVHLPKEYFGEDYNLNTEQRRNIFIASKNRIRIFLMKYLSRWIREQADAIKVLRKEERDMLLATLVKTERLIFGNNVPVDDEYYQCIKPALMVESEEDYEFIRPFISQRKNCMLLEIELYKLGMIILDDFKASKKNV